MENYQGPLPDGLPVSPTQHKNKARSYVDVTGKLYNTVPPGWTPVVTVEGWTNVYTESGKPVTAKRNQLTIIEEIPTITTASEETPPSGSSRPGWGWVTESSTYTIDIQTQSLSTDDPTTMSESTTHRTYDKQYHVYFEFDDLAILNRVKYPRSLFYIYHTMGWYNSWVSLRVCADRNVHSFHDISRQQT
ncbi:unnamed protein product [Fusarium langsethiae]|nr:unnamed protein product [Fusarium langsethiae]